MQVLYYNSKELLNLENSLISSTNSAEKKDPH